MTNRQKHANIFTTLKFTWWWLWHWHRHGHWSFSRDMWGEEAWLWGLIGWRTIVWRQGLPLRRTSSYYLNKEKKKWKTAFKAGVQRSKSRSLKLKQSTHVSPGDLPPPPSQPEGQVCMRTQKYSLQCWRFGVIITRLPILLHDRGTGTSGIRRRRVTGHTGRMSVQGTGLDKSSPHNTCMDLNSVKKHNIKVPRLIVWHNFDKGCP